MLPSIFRQFFLPPHHFTPSGGEERYNFFTSLETVLEIIMTSDYSNTLSSSDEDFQNDTTFNNNPSDSEDISEENEIIPTSLK